MTIIDNYGELLLRLNEAASSLRKRQDSLKLAHSVVAVMLADNQHGPSQWAERKARVDLLL